MLINFLIKHSFSYSAVNMIKWKIGGHHNRKPMAATITAATVTGLTIAAATITSPLLLFNGLTAQAQPSQSLAGITFPPPVFSTIRSQPAYEINIPFSSESKSVYSNQKRFQYQLE
jgi:hypothetical protein